MAISFHFTCSYQNQTEYDVYGHPFIKRIEAYSVCSGYLLKYQRQSFNGDDAEFERTMVARQGGVKLDYVDKRYVDTATYWADYRWPQDLYLAFVQWLKDEHAKYLAEHEHHRVKYGFTLEEYPALEARPIPRPIFYSPASKRYEVEPWFRPEMVSWGQAAPLVAA